MKKTLYAALVSALLLGHAATAQTRRAVASHQLWANAQAELALKNGDYLLLELHGENVPAYNRFSFRDRLLGFDTRGAAVAYEHFWSDHWSGGAALQHQSTEGLKVVAPELLLRHRSPVGPLTFGQRLSIYRVIPVGDRGLTILNEAANYASLRADLEKVFPIGGGSLMLRPRLSYEAVAHVRILKSNTDTDERTIEYTSLRAEVGVRVNDHFDFTPWFAYTTAYYFVLPFNTNPVGTPGTDLSRFNLVTPVIGLDARFTLFAGKTVFERRQLPTQH